MTTPPRNTDLIMVDQTGRKFIGRYASLEEILTPDQAQWAREGNPMDEPRWFAFEWKSFVVCAEPVKWMPVQDVTLDGGIAAGCG